MRARERHPVPVLVPTPLCAQSGQSQDELRKGGNSCTHLCITAGGRPFLTNVAHMPSLNLFAGSTRDAAVTVEIVSVPRPVTPQEIPYSSRPRK